MNIGHGIKRSVYILHKWNIFIKRETTSTATREIATATNWNCWLLLRFLFWFLFSWPSYKSFRLTAYSKFFVPFKANHGVVLKMWWIKKKRTYWYSERVNCKRERERESIFLTAVFARKSFTLCWNFIKINGIYSVYVSHGLSSSKWVDNVFVWFSSAKKRANNKRIY